MAKQSILHCLSRPSEEIFREGGVGLSKLSLGWMKLGIVDEHIQPGRPQQNGRHERMHRTLKVDTTKPPAASLRDSRAALITFAMCSITRARMKA
jgi:transposase InsO family protein